MILLGSSSQLYLRGTSMDAMDNKTPLYLGDGVYIRVKDGRYVITTSTHVIERADNVIYLEPEVMDALKEYAS